VAALISVAPAMAAPEGAAMGLLPVPVDADAASGEHRHVGDEPIPHRALVRADDGPDERFYALPRLVTHIDDRAIAAVGSLYEELRLADGEVLDLMSSWVSHFPRRPRRMVGLGMNAKELAANRMLDEHVVHDLNADPRVPFAGASFDAVTCCVSIDYLVRPDMVLAEVARVLRPGGVVVVTWSNRCFPTKAVRAWLERDDAGRIALVEAYLRSASPALEPPETHTLVPPDEHGDPLWASLARRCGVQTS